MKSFTLSLLFFLFFCIELYAQPFVKIGSVSDILMDLENGKAEWCDYDMDGDLDVVITGNSGIGPFTSL